MSELETVDGTTGASSALDPLRRGAAAAPHFDLPHTCTMRRAGARTPFGEAGGRVLARQVVAGVASQSRPREPLSSRLHAEPAPHFDPPHTCTMRLAGARTPRGEAGPHVS